MIESSQYKTQVAVRTAEELKPTLEQLYALVAPNWPLATAVAANPLEGLADQPFTEATERGANFFRANTLPSLVQMRWAMANRALQPNDLDQALQEALSQAPAKLPLGDQEVSLKPLVQLMVNQLDDEGRLAWPQTSLVIEAMTSLNSPEVPEINATINAWAIQWLGAFLDEGQAGWPMPEREQGFWGSIKTLLTHDPAFRSDHGFLRELPEDSHEALTELLEALHIPADQLEKMLRDHLLSLPGWAGFIQWRSQQGDYGPQQKHPINLTDYLAVRLLFQYLLPEAQVNEDQVQPQLLRLTVWVENELGHPQGATVAQWTELLQSLQQVYRDLRLALLSAWEESFRRELTQQVLSVSPAAADTRRPDAQMVFCIDVRSEPFRRQLEQVGAYETFGFAGFFGLPIAIETHHGKRVKSLPVLLQPAHQLCECTAPGTTEAKTRRYHWADQMFRDLKQTYKSLKYNLATPFAAVEAMGLMAGVLSAGRSVAPVGWMRMLRRAKSWFRPEIDWAPDPNAPAGDPVGLGIPREDQITYAGNALRMMGLTQNFAPLVVMCGHGSQTENNPYAAALDCGACGGSHGGPNAVAMATILNQSFVREALAEQGIEIPEDTLFLGAEHNTTTDEVTLLHLPQLKGPKQQQVLRLQKDLGLAQQANLKVRAQNFEDTEARSLLRKSQDWAELRPEWGLAGNAAFVVAPRELTRDLNLRGRCFLHSYDWQQDPESSSLEVILTAPLVVAQWINSQYYFSTVDPVAFGSGNKFTHNVVGKIGVMQGNASDLMHGLPLQSVMASDGELYHQPLRLMALVVAPRENVQALVEKHAILQRMFFGGWVTIRVQDPESGQLSELQTNGEWKAVEAEPIKEAIEA